MPRAWQRHGGRVGPGRVLRWHVERASGVARSATGPPWHSRVVLEAGKSESRGLIARTRSEASALSAPRRLERSGLVLERKPNLRSEGNLCSAEMPAGRRDT